VKKLVLTVAFASCGAVLASSPAIAASPAAAVAVASAACPKPPLAYRKGAKGAMWYAACVECKNVGPRVLARRINLSRTSASYVAHRYANRAVTSVLWQRYLPLVGGKAAAKAILYAGCMAGFHARGRP
jgi:hypothetical protein